MCVCARTCVCEFLRFFLFNQSIFIKTEEPWGRCDLIAMLDVNSAPAPLPPPADKAASFTSQVFRLEFVFGIVSHWNKKKIPPPPLTVCVCVRVPLICTLPNRNFVEECHLAVDFSFGHPLPHSRAVRYGPTRERDSIERQTKPYRPVFFSPRPNPLDR